MNTTPSLSLTASAAAHIHKVRGTRNAPSLYLRLTVEGGGCSGFKYRLDFDDTPPAADDITIETDGARLMTDPASLALMNGAVIDFKRDLMGSSFVIKNPNAQSRCGCGASFSVG